MNKQTKLLVLGLSSLLLCSCSASNQGAVSSDEGSSSYALSPWNSRDLDDLMRTYCGEVLPFSEKYIGSSFSFKEATQSDGTTYLEIKIEAEEFSMQDYYKVLQEANWNLVYGYDEEGKEDLIVRESSGTEFVELTKAGVSCGYDITYYFHEATLSDMFEGNVICCYNNLVSTMNEGSAWKADEAAKMKTVLTDTLPFIALGSNYSVTQTDTAGNTLLIADTSLTDRRKTYSDLLVKNGFTFDEEFSLSYGCYVLAKTLSDGNGLVVILDYSGGNYFQFQFRYKTSQSMNWPSSALSSIEKSTGVTIPSFPSEGNYSYYSKNGVVTIYADVSSSFLESEDYREELNEAGLIDFSGYGDFWNWEETLEVQCYSSDGAKFCLIATPQEPTSSFSAAWPEEAIAYSLNSLGVTTSFPKPMLPDGTSTIKYVDSKTTYQSAYEDRYSYVANYGDQVGVDMSDEKAVKEAADILAREKIGIELSFYDTEKEVYDSLDSYYYVAAYHQTSSFYGCREYEDPTGNVMIILDHSPTSGVTTAHISVGSKKTHTPSLSFKRASYSLGVGTSTKIPVVVDMLPYDIVYSSSDASGKVTIDSNGVVSVADDATIGSKATITATLSDEDNKVYTATCEITVAARSEYDYKTAMDKVVELFNAKLGYASGDEDALYTCYNKSEDYYWVLYNYVQTSGSPSGNDVKDICKNYLVPEGFTLYSDWKTTVSKHGNTEFICTYFTDGVKLEYTVTMNDGLVLVIINSYAGV